jgi:multidrug resistance efflux pump
MNSPPLRPARPRRVPPVAWLALVLLTASVAYAGVTLRSPAGATGAPGPADSRGREPSPVAVAYVDVEEGVSSLYPQQPGRVVAVLAREGQEFEKGAPLFRVDDTLAQDQLAAARLDQKAAEQRLVQARRLVAQHEKKKEAQQAAVEVARREAEAAHLQARLVERNFKRGVGGTAEGVQVAKKMAEKADAAVRAEEAKLAAVEAMAPVSAVPLAETDVQAKRKQVEKAEYAVKECTVSAPFKGTVLRSQVTVGEVLGPSPRKEAIVFCPSGPRVVRAEVEQEFAGRVRVGLKAHVQDDATGGGEWHGKVARVSDWYTQRRSVLLEPLQYNDVRTLECIIQLDSQKGLRIGQRVRVTFEGGN